MKPIPNSSFGSFGCSVSLLTTSHLIFSPTFFMLCLNSLLFHPFFICFFFSYRRSSVKRTRTRWSCVQSSCLDRCSQWSQLQLNTGFLYVCQERVVGSLSLLVIVNGLSIQSSTYTSSCYVECVAHKQRLSVLVRREVPSLTHHVAWPSHVLCSFIPVVFPCTTLFFFPRRDSVFIQPPAPTPSLWSWPSDDELDELCG